MYDGSGGLVVVAIADGLVSVFTVVATVVAVGAARIMGRMVLWVCMRCMCKLCIVCFVC